MTQQAAIQTIGYAVAAEAFDYSVPQEFAGAVETVRIPAGRYPVEIRRGQYNHLYAGISLSGTLTYSGWFGSNTRVSHPNTPAEPFAQHYLYELAGAFGGKRLRKALSFELADGYELRDGDIYCGDERVRVNGV